MFTFKKIDGEVLAVHHEQEQPPILNVHYTNYRPEYEEILHEKIFVIDDGDHSTMLFAYGAPANPTAITLWALLCIVKVSRKATEFGLSLAQPCALCAVALTVHQPDTRPLP